MKRPAGFLLCFLGLISAATGAAADIKIAVVAPDKGAFQLLGRQIRDGAAFQADERGIEIVPIAETCEAGGDGEIAKAIIAADVDAAIGFLCSESIEGALPSLKDAGIPAISVSVRSTILMEDVLKNEWPFFRLAPSSKAEAQKIVGEISARWKDKSFAMIEDGTIYSRELVDTVRTSLEEIGMKPVFTDTYRPAQEQQLTLVRRLAATGATHVFIAGDRTDTAIIARDSRGEGMSLTFLGADSTKAANQPVPLVDGVMAVTMPETVSSQTGAAIVAAMRAAGIEPEGYVLPTFAAVSILEQARAIEDDDGTPLRSALLKADFPTVLGPVGFGPDHERRDNPYRLMIWQQNRFVLVDPAGETQ